MVVIKIVYCLAISILLIVYILYPSLLQFLTIIIGRKKVFVPNNCELPSVCLIISAYNEEKIIEKKLSNSLRLDYPQNKLEIVVVSDCSTDDTDNIVRNFGRKHVRLFRPNHRRGKTNAINLVMPTISSEIVLFTDANSMLDAGSLKRLVGHFNKETVGGVCGKLVYVNNSGIKKKKQVNENVYWKYENWIKQNENKLSLVVVYNGSIYALRKLLHKPLDIKAANDFQHPIQVLLQGYINVYDSEAAAYEKESRNDLVEFKRHVRITLRGWNGLLAYPAIINPFIVGWTGIHFLIRKVIRWLSPVFLIIVFASNILLLDIAIFRFLFILQLLFYIVAFIGFIFSKFSNNIVLKVIYYFCLTNFALLIALIKFILKRESAVWKPTSHHK